ncbi:MAG: InlB B-repeat-containing protein, partial [Firmicutes bacterium]|nr:InlB B-repeat-containing protein [Bacillota bacterium]
NSGHMGNYFSIQGGTVTYNDCTFSNGACMNTGTAIYNNCTFNNTSEYGLWVYDDALVTVNGGTIDSVKGIKVYSEGETSVTSTLTVQNATFTEALTKPAVAIGYAESITLIGNTYNNTTDVLELDSGSDADCEGIDFVAEDASGNDISATLTAVDRSKSNAACGVLVEGKIYTTITEAAKDVESGNSVTLLYSTEETVELPKGVELNFAEGVEADNVSVVVGKIATGVVKDDANVENDSYINFELSELDAKESIEIKVYAGNTLLSTTELVKTEYLSYTNLSAKVEITDESGSWETTWAVEPISNLVPDKAELYVDGNLAATANRIDMYSADVPSDAREWKDIEGVAIAPEGSLTNAYTGEDDYWGECGGNAKESFEFKFYNDTTYMGYTSLNDVDDIIDGDVYVTWRLELDAKSNADPYWTMEWKIAPTLDMQPNRVEQWVDGVKVAEAEIELNGPDNIQKIVAVVADEEGTITGYYTSLETALAKAADGAKIQLVYNEGDQPIAMNGAVYGDKTVTITGTAKVDWSKGFLFVGRGGEGDGKIIFEDAELTSASNSTAFGINVSGHKKGSVDTNDGAVDIKDSTIELDYLINKGNMTLDNSTLTVKNGFSIGGRLADETESGEDATATITLNNGSKIVVNNHNGMGLGYEAIGVMDIDETSAFETTQDFLVTAKGTMNIGGMAKIAGTLTNNGTINLTEAGATLTAQEGLTVNGIADYKVVYEEGTYKLDECVAKIGDVAYLTLQEAIDNVQNGETIKLLTDCDETVIVNKSGVAFTIDGKISEDENATFTGEIKINIGQNLIVKNIDFVHEETVAHDFIKNEGSPTGKNYNTTLVVDGCTFTGNGEDNTVAVRMIHPTDVTIQNSTGTGLHSLMQNTGGQKVTVDNVTVTESKGGISLGGVRKAAVKNTDITVSEEGYGIRIDAATADADIIIDSCDIDAFIPVVVRKATADNVSLTIEGVNNMTQKNTDGYWCVIGTSEYEENGSLPENATGKISATLKGCNLSAEGIYGLPADEEVEVVIVEVTVTFDQNYDEKTTTVSAIKGQAVTRPVDPIREGYTFNGWYIDDEYTEEFSFETLLNGDMTLCAKWTIN